MANITIPELNAANLVNDSLFETAEPASGNTYTSKKASAGDIATFVGTTKTFSGLTTTNKTLVGAINEITTHTYSTSEQVVGTWIDGRSIYEKTYVTTMASGTLTKDIVFTDIINFDAILELNGLFDSQIPFTLNGAIRSNHFKVDSLSQYAAYGYITSDGIRLSRESVVEYSDAPKVVVTIRYLKTAVS